MSNKRALVISLLINFFLLGHCLIFGNLAFGATDDYFMARLLEGVYGENYNVHLTFVNVLYGYALLPFYYLFPKIGWYYIGEMAGVFLSFTTIGIIIIKRMGPQWGPILALLFSAAFASDCYLSVQFTQCAALYSATGMLLFLSYATKKEHSSKNEKIALLISALFFLLWGAIMRREAFLMGVPFFAFALLLYVKDCWKHKTRTILGLIILLIGLTTIQWIDKKHYEAPDYRYYKEFQSLRATFGDGAFFDASAVADEFDEQGSYSEEFHLLRNWVFYDSQVFSVDSLRNYAKSVYANTLDTKPVAILYTLPSALANATNKPMFWIWFLFCGVLFLIKNGRSYAWGSILIIAMLTSYLLILNRIVYRVEMGFWLYATALAIPFMKSVSQIPPKFAKSALAVSVIAITATFGTKGDYVRNQTNGRNLQVSKAKLTHYADALDYIESLPSNYAVLASHTTYIFFSKKKEPPYRSEPFGSWKKIIPMGYWTPFFPDIENTLKEKGIKNPLKDATKENVLVVGNNVLNEFLERHYDDSVSVRIEKEFDVLKFYKYTVSVNQ